MFEKHRFIDHRKVEIRGKSERRKGRKGREGGKGGRGEGWREGGRREENAADSKTF